MQNSSQRVNIKPTGESGHLGDYVHPPPLFSLDTENTYSEGNVCSFLTERDLFQPATALCLLS